MTPADWSAPAAPGPLDATVVLPGSKSLTNRYLVLAALASGVSRLRRPLRSRDTELMAAALRSLGAGVEDATTSGHHADAAPDWIITPSALRGGRPIDCGLAGTVMRFLPPVAALCREPVAFDGDEQARVRPMAAILDALRNLGVEVEDEGRGPGLRIHGKPGEGPVPLARERGVRSDASLDGMPYRHASAPRTLRGRGTGNAVQARAWTRVDPALPVSTLLRCPGRGRLGA